MSRISDLKALIAKLPEDETLRFALGRLLSEARDADGAVEAFREAVRLKPDFTAVYLALGKELKRAGRLDEAREAFQAGLEAAARTRDELARKAMEALLRALP